MKQGRKKMLLISYHFPPSSAVGGLRALNFARNLPAFGYDISVLTVDEKHIERIDPGRKKDTAAIKVYRAGKIPSITGLYRSMKFGYASLTKKDLIASSSGQSLPNPKDRSAEPLVKRLRRYIKSFIFFPDNERNWIIPAYLKALRIMRQEGIDCIMTSCPPYSAHILGLLLKIATGVKWVADFRDPWMLKGSKLLYSTSALSLRIETWIEKKTLLMADLVTFNVESLKEQYRKKHGPLSNDGKFVFVPNGFDPEYFKRFKKLSKYETFTLCYTGSLYVGRTPEPVFKAIRELMDEGVINSGLVKIKLIGECGYINGVPASRLISSYGLEDAVEVMESIPYEKAVEEIRKSHVALLFAPNLPYQIPAKVYDYMGAGTQILAISEGGGTAELVNSSGAGKAFAPEDIKGIKEFIKEKYLEKEGQQSERENAFSRFESKNIARDMASNISELVFKEDARANRLLGVDLRRP